jgi:hypothetical protein
LALAAHHRVFPEPAVTRRRGWLHAIAGVIAIFFIASHAALLFALWDMLFPENALRLPCQS